MVLGTDLYNQIYSLFMDARPCRNIAAVPNLFYFSSLRFSIELSLLDPFVRFQLARRVKSIPFVTEFMYKVREYERVSLSLDLPLGANLGPTNS